jgi:hypothetical protein
MPAKTPQDRKTADDLYRFTVQGKSFTLPSPESAAPKVGGGVTMDAILAPDDEMAQLRLGLAMLNASGADPEALAALRSMPAEEMLTTVGEWMEHKPKGQASVGESSGSSN